MNGWKKAGIAIGSILLVLCLSIDVWYGYILLFGKEKIVSKTFKVSTLTLADGSQEYMLEVEYFANKDGSGYEALEIKYSYFLDESRDDTYSQGYQYVADKGYPIEFNGLAGEVLFKEKEPFRTEGSLWWKDKFYNCQVPTVPTDNITTYPYMSSADGFVKSTNPIDSDSYLKIQIGDDLYAMQFKGANKYDEVGNLIENTPMSSDLRCGSSISFGELGADTTYYYHTVYDVHHFSRLLYEAVKSEKLGQDSEVVFEFGNLFNYYKFNQETGTYDENRTNYDDTIKIQTDIKSYYSIRVRTHEYGLSKASDSLFGSVLGNQSYNATDNYANDSYFIGRTAVDCGINSFDFVTIEDNNVALKLSQSFIDYYSIYKSQIVLSVNIDLDLLENLGYNFVGFTSDNGLNNFDIYQCYTSSGGELVEDLKSTLTEVKYD